MAETSSLLNCRSSKGYRGFESPSLHGKPACTSQVGFFAFQRCHQGHKIEAPPTGGASILLRSEELRAVPKSVYTFCLVFSTSKPIRQICASGCWQLARQALPKPRWRPASASPCLPSPSSPAASARAVAWRPCRAGAVRPRAWMRRPNANAETVCAKRLTRRSTNCAAGWRPWAGQP